MPRVRKPVVELAPDGTVAERWDSMYDLTRQYGRDRFFFRKSCNTGILYLGRRFMWADDYERAVAEGRTGELAYGRQSHTPVIYRRRVAYTYDYRGADDDRLVFICNNSRIPQDEDKHGGVGLANVKQRLDLIFKDRYTLDIKDEPNLYSVTLNIPL